MKAAIKNWIYNLAVRIIAKRIINSSNRLTPEYLLQKGWVEENEDYFEPNVKDRDRIIISFEGNYYRVWHSANRTFIALESTLEWFELHYMLSHPDNLHKIFEEQNRKGECK